MYGTNITYCQTTIFLKEHTAYILQQELIRR